MKNFLTLFLPLLIVLSLNGCTKVSDYVYIKYDFREVYVVKDWPMNTETELDGYEVEINGEWYEADKNGNLTEGGKRAKQALERRSSDGDDDGGGC